MGAGGRSLAEMLRSYLEMKCPLTQCEWTVFDKNLVELAMKEHQLPARFAKFIPEDRVSEIQACVGELLGLHPSLWQLNKDVYETIIHLGGLGGAILVGRGGNLITKSLNNGFHIRLIGSPEQKIERVVKYYNIPYSEAKQFVKRQDSARRKWVKDHFNVDVEDPENYDVVINTDRMPIEDAAKMVSTLIRKRYPAGIGA